MQLWTKRRLGGGTYTPKLLSDFVAAQIVKMAGLISKKKSIKVLDPAVGGGELLVSLLDHLPSLKNVEVHGFDTNQEALISTEARLRKKFPQISMNLKIGDFLNFVLAMCGGDMEIGLFEPAVIETYDLIIANPPYVRTQILGAGQAQNLAMQFGLTGRVDLYYAFILGMAKVLKPHGVAGIIVSNRFMTTKSGGSVRRAIQEPV